MTPSVVDSIMDHESDAEDVDFQFPDVSDSETCARLIKLAISTGDDFSDETWLPPHEARRAAQRNKSTTRPKEYKKGPDIGSKAVRTKQRYRKLLQNQTSLTSFGFICKPRPSSPHLPNGLCMSEEPNVTEDDSADLVQSMAETLEEENTGAEMQNSRDELQEAHLIENDMGLIWSTEEEWEDELEEQERGGVEVRGWDKL